MKTAVLILGSLLFVTGIHAQYGYELGARAGFNLSTQHTTGIASQVETTWKPGFHIGIFGRLLYTERMAGQLEFLYSEKGSLWSDPQYEGEEVVTYVDVPLTARFQVLNLLNIHAGPQFSFFTGAWRMPEEGRARSVSENYDEVDVGVLLGAELVLPIKLNIAVRYVEGLMVSTDSRYYPDPWKNRVFQLSLSYAILGE